MKLAGALGLGPAPRLRAEPGLEGAMADAAAAFAAALDPDRRRAAVHSLTPALAADWHYVPRRREGLPLGSMSALQRDLAWALVDAGLGARGRAQARGVLALERVLQERAGGGAFRDPGNYALLLMGTPEVGGRDPWAWRFEGHHLSLTFVVAPGTGVAASPLFVGANPAGAPVPLADGGHGVGPLLGRETGLGFELMRALGEGERRAALIADRSPADIVTGPGRERDLAERRGVALAALGDGARNLALALIEAYARRLRGELAERELAALRDAGVGEVRFAWAGPVREGERSYHRLHGPTLIVEHDNTTGDHIHTVWHDPRDPFGEDLLRRHRRLDHGG